MRSPAALLAGLLLTSLVLGAAGAQENTDKQAEPAPAATPPSGGDGGAKPAVKRFKDWSLTCTKPTGAEPERCYIFQNLVLKKGGQRLLNVVVGHLAADRKPAAILTLPLGIALPPGGALRVDEGEPVRFVIERCTPQGCVGGINLDDTLLAALKGGKQAKVSFSDLRRREIVVPVSLAGFTAAYKQLP